MMLKEYLFLISCLIRFIESEPDRISTTENTRRILHGVEVDDTRPYMVWLRPAQAENIKNQPKLDSNWLCGGVIVHERYIITSASCIEEVKHFYVVSGTNKWLPLTETNECITLGAKRAVWKCVPKDYIFDGGEFDNIRWMAGDIAIVKVEDDFNFEKRVRGCDFIPKKARYNNETESYESKGTIASTAGWGTTDVFGNRFNVGRQVTINSPVLMETDVVLLSKKNCKKRWDSRYHSIIDSHMICAQDSNIMDSSMCLDKEVKCKELTYANNDGDSDETARRILGPNKELINDPKTLLVHSAAHHNSNLTNHTRRKVDSGGFCENDHGGPLMYGQGPGAIVIGVISACMTKTTTKKCYGPFLFTSVYTYRNLISCAIDKDTYGPKSCRTLLRASNTSLQETTLDWNIGSPTPENETATGYTDNQSSLKYYADRSQDTKTQLDDVKKSTMRRRLFWTQKGGVQNAQGRTYTTIGLKSKLYENRGSDYDIA